MDRIRVAFLTAKYRTYFACQYQRHRWQLPSGPGSPLSPFGPCGPPRPCGPATPCGPCGPYCPWGSLWTGLPWRTLLPSGTNWTLWSRGASITSRPKRTHRFTCRLASFTDLAVNIYILLDGLVCSIVGYFYKSRRILASP